MKFKFLILFTCAFFIGHSQLKVTTGETLFVSNGETIYSNDNIINDGTITIGTGKLVVSGNIDNNGTLSMSNGTLNVQGANTQTFDFGSSDVVKKLELDKSSGTATFNSGSLSITDYLLSTQGTIDGGGKLFMKSTSSKTAIVLQSSGGTVNNIVVERYIPSKRAFRLLSSPVTTSTSIKYNWQENQNNTSAAFANNINTTANYGTHITGSTSGSNGFDATQSGNASLYLFNNTLQTWSSINNTDTNTLTSGGAYRLLVRGSRAVDLTNNAATPSVTTLRTNGSLKIGSYTNSDLSQVANGFNFIGNPYQSAVSIADVLTASTNLNSNFYYVWDPKVGGTNGRGAFVTYTFSGNTNSVSGSAVNQYLEPMQACFVKTLNNGAASITFNETNKYTSTNENVYRTNNSYATNSLRLTLYDANSFNLQQTPSDGALLLFNDTFNNNIDANDADKMSNLDENISIVSGTSKLSIGCFQNPIATTIFPLNINQYRSTQYTLVAEKGTNEGLTPYIYDAFLQTYTEINPVASYNFSIDSNNSLTSAANRFEIIYSTTSLTNPEFADNTVALYPNPSIESTFSIQVPGTADGYSVKIYNTLGQLIEVKTTTSSNNAIECKLDSSLMTGIYQVIISKDNTSVVKKWIKK